MRNAASYVILGRGGSEPGADVYDPISGDLRSMIRFRRGHGVYAFDRSPGGGKVLIGTKNGKVIRLSTNDGSALTEFSECRDGKTLPHGEAAVLDARFISEDSAVVCNNRGGCRRYDFLDNGIRSSDLQSGDKPVCALGSLSCGLLAGLGINGRLVVWKPGTGEIIECLTGPPISVSAFFRLTDWRESGQLIYASKTGSLMSLDRQKGILNEHDAHDGQWFASAVVGELLMTIGFEDRRVILWDSNLSRVGESASPEGVVAAAAAGGDPGQIILIHESGRAGLYQIDGGRLIPDCSLVGDVYRSCLGVVSSSLEKFSRDAEESRVRGIVTEIRVRDGNDEESEALHGRLESEGFGHVSLAVKIDRDLKRGQIAEALRHSSRLVDMLPEDASQAFRPLLQYGLLLEEAWIFSEAVAVYERARRLDPSSWSDFSRSRNLGDPTTSEHRSEFMCPDLQLELVMECFEVVAQPFIGRWLVCNRPPCVCRRVEIGAAEFAERWNRVEKDTGDGVVDFQVCRFRSREEDTIHPTVLFRKKVDDSTFKVYLGLRWDAGDAQTTVHPFTCFEAAGPRSEISFVEHSRRAAEAFRKMRSAPSIHADLNALLNKAVHLLRRMITAARRAETAAGR